MKFGKFLVSCLLFSGFMSGYTNGSEDDENRLLVKLDGYDSSIAELDYILKELDKCYKSCEKIKSETFKSIRDNLEYLRHLQLPPIPFNENNKKIVGSLLEQFDKFLKFQGKYYDKQKTLSDLIFEEKITTLKQLRDVMKKKLDIGFECINKLQGTDT